MLLPHHTPHIIEAGCDEAGRGCLVGDVFAAAVILPPDYHNPLLNDSKKLTETMRYRLRTMIEQDAVAFAIASASPQEIDEINILKASFLAMHRAIAKLTTLPDALLIDGNRFVPYDNIPHTCIIKGDSKYLSIAAASILAKTYRDDYMLRLHNQYPHYGYANHKGYPTAAHYAAIATHGITALHRKTFRLTTTAKSPNCKSLRP